MRRPCGPAVYWFWDHVPGAAESRSGARAIADGGFAMAMIQGRLSLPRETYLSDAWLSGYREAVRALGEAGLEVGIYDEYNWLSGHGGGRTVAGAGDALRERHLFWTSTGSVSGIASDWIDGLGPAGARWIYEDGVRRWDDWELVAAVLQTPDGGVVDVTDRTSVSGSPGGCRVSAPPGALAFVSGRCATSRIPNFLDERVAPRFLEVVHEPYLRALDGLIGDPVTCLSFDHPYGGFYDWRERTGDVRCSLLWDASLPGDPATLCGLVSGDGPEAIAARTRFFAAYARRMASSFLDPLRAFADGHGLDLTGHELLGHVGGWPLVGEIAAGLDVRASFGADPFAVDVRRTVTLVDASNDAAQLSPVMGDSLARAHGRSRCTVEQYMARRDPPEDYAAGVWELTLPRLRMQALRLHVLGARRFLFHAVSLSDGWPFDGELLSNPRFDFPPAIDVEPWWPWVDLMCAESERVSSFIDGGEPIRDVALVHPLATLWAFGQDHACAALFGARARGLCEAGIGVDVIDDRAIERAAVRDGRLVVSSNGYSTVVLPGCEVVPSAATASVLSAFARAGGTVVVDGPAPAWAADGSPVSWSVPPASLEVDPFDGVWRWVGHDRLVLVNDSTSPRSLRVDDRSVELEPGAVACLSLPLAGDVVAPRFRTVGELVDGWTLSFDDAGDPVAIDPSCGWEVQGFPDVSGVGTYRCRVEVPAEATALELPAVECAATAWLGDVPLGRRGWPPYRFDLPAGVPARAKLRIDVASAAANRFYAGTRFAGPPQPSGLTAVPRWVAA